MENEKTLNFDYRLARKLFGIKCSMKCLECGNIGLIEVFISSKRRPSVAFVCPCCERVHDIKGNAKYLEYPIGTKIPEYFRLLLKGKTYRKIGKMKVF